MYVSACVGVQVYRMGYPGFLELYFTVEEHDKATMTLGQEDVVSVTELNGRSLDIRSEQLSNTLLFRLIHVALPGDSSQCHLPNLRRIVSHA